MLSVEQQAIIDAVNTSTDGIIAVNAVAGSGKTHTANAIINSVKPKNGFYTAFNKAIVTDSNKKFGSQIECRTIHSLAYQAIRPSKIEDLSYNTIKENIPYEDKSIIINTLDDFFRSKSIDLYDYVETHVDKLELRELIVLYAEKMLEGEIPATFNYLLKCLQIMLANNEIEITKDLLILDECQDTTAVSLEIFKLINCPKKVILGDKFQNIYSFMNTVNAFEELDNLSIYPLTKSYRCHPNVAEQVEAFGKRFLTSDFKYTGNDELVLNPNKVSKVYLTRTNSTLINQIYDLLRNNNSFTLTRNPTEIFALPIALLNASLGKPVFDKKYSFLEKEYNYFNKLNLKNVYSNFLGYINETIDDVNIKSATNIIRKFSKDRVNLYQLREDTLKAIKKPNKDIILTTAHTFKGLEADIAHIGDDLNGSVLKAIETIGNRHTMPIEEVRKELDKDTKENLNVYYVALSRGKFLVENNNY